MQFGCCRFLRKDQKKDPFPFLSYERKSYRLIIVAWKQISVSSVLVHFPSSLDEFIHLFHSTRVLDEFVHLFHSTCVLDEFIHLFHSTCVLDEFIHSFHSTLPTHSCGVPYTQQISTPNTVKHLKLIGTQIQSTSYHIGTAPISTSLNC
jgi:hypothetical protein